MIIGHVVEFIDDVWRIISAIPNAGMISQEPFSSEDEAHKDLREGNYSFY